MSTTYDASLLPSVNQSKDSSLFLSASQAPPNLLSPSVFSAQKIPEYSNAEISKLSRKDKRRLEISSGIPITNDNDLSTAKVIIAKKSKAGILIKPDVVDLQISKENKKISKDKLKLVSDDLASGLEDAIKMGQETKDLCPDWGGISCPFDHNLSELVSKLNIEKYKNKLTTGINNAISLASSIGADAVGLFSNVIKCGAFLAATAASKVTSITKAVAGIGNAGMFKELVSVLDSTHVAGLSLDDPLGIVKNVLKNGALGLDDAVDFKNGPVAQLGVSPVSLISPFKSFTNSSGETFAPIFSIDSFSQATGLNDVAAINAFNRIYDATKDEEQPIGLSSYNISEAPLKLKTSSIGGEQNLIIKDKTKNTVTDNVIEKNKNSICKSTSVINIRKLTDEEKRKIAVLSAITNRPVEELEMAYIISSGISSGKNSDALYTESNNELASFVELTGLSYAQAEYLYSVGNINDSLAQKKLGDGITELINSGSPNISIADDNFIFNKNKILLMEMSKLKRPANITATPKQGSISEAKRYADKFNLKLDSNGVPIIPSGKIKPGNYSVGVYADDSNVTGLSAKEYGATHRFDSNVNIEAATLFKNDYDSIYGVYA